MQDRVRLRDGLVHEVVRVVQVHDVDAVDAKPVQALVQRTQDPVAAEVEHRPRRGRVGEEVGARLRVGDDEPAHLGGQHEIAVPAGPQRRAEPAFGGAVAVQRRGVEVAHARVTGPAYHGPRLGVGHRPEQPAQRRAAEAQLGDLDPAAAQKPSFTRYRVHVSPVPYRW